MTKRLLLLFTFSLVYVALNAQCEPLETYLLKVDASFDEQELMNKGICLGSKAGNIITLTCTSNQSELLANTQGILLYQKANPVKPNLAKTLTDTRVDQVHQGLGLDQKYSGKDVIIGITDWGFDYTHPNFYDTTLQKTRILAAWDQFKTAGPAPDGFNYGTVYEGETELLAAQSDTFNIYQYATHGSHVAGICGGSGAGTSHRGMAYEANFLFTTFLANEGAVLDAIAWMKEKADEHNKRLVVNMSWGLYNLGPLDGTSLLSQAIDHYSAQGVVFVTSGGNNGGEEFHIKHDFSKDTIRTQVGFYPYSAHPAMWGQNIAMWGSENHPFSASFLVLDNANTTLLESPVFTTSTPQIEDNYLLVGNDTIFYKVEVHDAYPTNDVPHIRLRIKNENTSLRIGLKSFAEDGTVHYYNVVELTNDVGNWGLPFSDLLPGWLEGDDEYSLGEPASTRSVISVAAHQSETILGNGTLVGGTLAAFSSKGPTIDGRMKPDISAPGVNVASSISSFTSRSFTSVESVSFNGRTYPFARFSGTSMSSPAVAGIVSLMLEANSNLMPTDVKDILLSTARADIKTGDLPDAGSLSWGRGKVTATDAVKMAEERRPQTLPYFIPPTFQAIPNPSASLLYFDGARDSTYKAQLITIRGQIAFDGVIGIQDPIDVSCMVRGLYILRFEDEDLSNQLIAIGF